MLSTGNRIKKLRELRGYSQVYMARKLGISQEQYSYLETKQKRIDEVQVRKIAALLDVKEELLRNFDPSVLLNDTTTLEFQNLVQQHEQERKLFVDLIRRLTDELSELKQRSGS